MQRARSVCFPKHSIVDSPRVQTRSHPPVTRGGRIARSRRILAPDLGDRPIWLAHHRMAQRSPISGCAGVKSREIEPARLRKELDLCRKRSRTEAWNGRLRKAPRRSIAERFQKFRRIYALGRSSLDPCKHRERRGRPDVVSCPPEPFPGNRRERRPRRACAGKMPHRSTSPDLRGPVRFAR